MRPFLLPLPLLAGLAIAKAAASPDPRAELKRLIDGKQTDGGSATMKLNLDGCDAELVLTSTRYLGDLDAGKPCNEETTTRSRFALGSLKSVQVDAYECFVRLVAPTKQTVDVEHPTCGMASAGADITMEEVESLSVTLCEDKIHSRIADNFILLAKKCGAKPTRHDAKFPEGD